MLKLFRQFSKSGTDPRSRSRIWMFALGEFVLVVLGLFLALQIENWNQNRQDRQLEHVLLRDMKANLENDLRDANWNYRFLNRFKRSNEVVLSYLDGEITYHDSLEYHFANLIGGAIFDENPSAYESLKSIGLDLIRNDTLRQKLTYLYENRYDYIRGVEAAFQEYINVHMYDNLANHIRIQEGLVSAIPLDREALRNDNAFRLGIILNIEMYNYDLYAYDLVLDRIEDIIKTIELELK